MTMARKNPEPEARENEVEITDEQVLRFARGRGFRIGSDGQVDPGVRRAAIADQKRRNETA